jgi:gas vesicle protein
LAKADKFSEDFYERICRSIMSRDEYRREEGASVSEKLTYLLIGGGIGAVIALLFAPKSGVELREDIADATRKGLEKGREAAQVVGERAGEYYEVAKERGSEYYQAARDKAGELYQTAGEKAKQLTDAAREKISEPTGNLTAAIEAGKRAYHEEKRKSESSVIAEGRPNYPKELGEE